jgi:hypothetical protein
MKCHASKVKKIVPAPVPAENGILHMKDMELNNQAGHQQL